MIDGCAAGARHNDGSGSDAGSVGGNSEPGSATVFEARDEIIQEIVRKAKKTEAHQKRKEKVRWRGTFVVPKQAPSTTTPSIPPQYHLCAAGACHLLFCFAASVPGLALQPDAQARV